MDLRKKINTKSIFSKFLISYFLILLIPIITNTFYSYFSMKVIEKYIYKVQTSSLNQLKDVLDNNMEQIRKIQLELSTNNKVNSLALVNRPLTPSEMFDKSYIVNYLNSYRTANNFIDSIYIYFNKNDFIVGDSGSSEPESYYQYYYKQSGITFPMWKKTLDKQYLYNCIATNKSGSRIAFITSIPVGRDNFPNATIIIEPKMKMIGDIISDIKWISNGTVLILDENNNVITSSNQINVSELLKHNKLKGGYGLFHEKLDNNDLVVSYTKSSVTDWKYVSVMPETIYMKELKKIKTIVFMTILLCFLIGSLVAYAFSKKNYRPINKLISLFNSDYKRNEVSGYNEYAFIENSILDMISEKEKIYKKLDAQKGALRENFIKRIVRGYIDSDTYEDTCDMYDISFQSDNFAIIMIYIEGYENIFFEKTKCLSDEVPDFTDFIIKNIFQDIIGEKQICYSANINDSLVCFINFKNYSDNLIIEIRDAGEYGRKFIKDRFGINLSLSISNIVNGIKSIPKAYDEAAEAMEYRVIFGSGHVICYNEIKTNANSLNCNSFNKSQAQFTNCINVKDYAAAKQILEQILNQFSSSSSLQVVKIQMFTLINTMLSAIEEVSSLHSDRLFEDMNIAERLVNCKSVDQLKNTMLYIMDYFCKLDNSPENKNNNLLENIKQFIEKNHANENLSVSMIAEHFDLHPNYLSRFFKQEYETGLLNYIQNIRVKNAKILLQNDELSIKDIAERVGYYNDVTFIRVFKKFEGVTPGKYKEILKKVEKA